jgi:hypothetical protein
MATIVLGDHLIIDGVDVTESCLAWQLQQVGRDVPTVTLELRPGADSVLFNGYANVRVATQGLDAVEFLAAVDAEELEKSMLESIDEPAGVAALRVLRDLASKLAP